MSYLLTGTGNPFATIQAAVNAAVSGDTIGVGPNVGNSYPEAILVNNKYVHLIGLVENQVIALPGAGGGAAPTILVTGTGGIVLENFTCSNVGSAHTDVLTLNVYQHWVRRVRVNGTGGKVCFRAQYLENCIAYNGLNGFVSSCPGENILRHVTIAKMTGQGAICSPANGSLEACLVMDTVGGSVVNYNNPVCKWNVTGDAVVVGPDGKNLTLAQVAFANYAGGDLSLLPSSLAWFPGVSPLATEFKGRRRSRFANYPRIYAGAYDPYPDGPAFVTGASQARRV